MDQKVVYNRETFHSLVHLVRQIYRDLEQYDYLKFEKEDKKTFDSRKAAVSITIDSIDSIEQTIDEIEHLPTRLSGRYHQEVKSLLEERERLVDLLIEELKRFSDKQYSFKKSALAIAALKEAKWKLNHTESYSAKSASRRKNEDIKQKNNDLNRNKNTIEKELTELEHLIKDVELRAGRASDEDPIKDQVIKEVKVIKRNYPPRVVKTTKELVDRLENLKSRQLTLEYIELISIPNFLIRSKGISKFKHATRNASFADKLVYARIEKIVKVLKKVNKSLKRDYVKLSKEKEKNYKEIRKIETKEYSLESHASLAHSALEHYNHALSQNERDIEIRKQAEKVRYSSTSGEVLIESEIQQAIKELNTPGVTDKRKAELRVEISNNRNKLEEMKAKKEQDANRKPQYTEIISSYTNMEDRIDNTGRRSR